jgi:hypothetical protein
VIKMDLKEMGCEGAMQMQLATDRVKWKTVTTKVTVFLHYPIDPEEAVFMSRILKPERRWI